MRKDIKSINEAYIKSTKGLINESFNEGRYEDYDYETEGAKTALDQIKDRLHYLSPNQLKELQSIVTDEVMGKAASERFAATFKAASEKKKAPKEDEEYGDEIGSESDEQRLNRLYDEYDEALMRDDMASAREIGLEIAELTGDQNDDEYGSHESEEYGDEHNYV